MSQVSVVIAVYNGADLVGAAIESALAQTLADVEVVVVDDGSTDTTAAVLDRFADRITVLRQQNRGLAAARNAVLPRLGSPYVAFLDHDDLWHPAFLERCVQRLGQADAQVAGVATGWVCIDRGGRELPNTRQLVSASIDLPTLAIGNRFAPGQVVLRRQAVAAAGGFDETLGGTLDWDLWLRLAQAGWRFVTIPDHLWQYRRHADNMSNHAGRMRDDALRTLDKLFANPALASQVQALRPRAVGNVWLHASEQFYAAGRDAEGAHNFAAAVRVNPALLRDDDTFWAILCAERPPGHHGPPPHLDLDRGERHVLGALDAVRSAGHIDAAAYRRALGRAYRSLTALAYGQRSMAAVRRYAAAAVRADPPLWRDRSTMAVALKSLAGAWVIETLSRRRR